MSPVKLPLGPLMVDVAGAALRAEEAEFLRHPAVGGVILFARNYESKAQVRELVAAIRGVRAPALLVAVDQEGGAVQRFREGFAELPPLGDFGDLYEGAGEDAGARAAVLARVEASGGLMAREVLEVGVDVSFAPVLDRRDGGSEVIGARAFHAEAGAICELAEAYARGMKGAGMAAVGKHFPGHGGVRADSHVDLAVDGRGLAEVEAEDLLPYAHLMRRGLLGGVMTAHVLFADVDARQPCYSEFWLREVLRGRYGFGGVIFSDDLSMAGAAVGGVEGDGAAGRCIAALQAGCDMVLVCNDAEGARAAAEGILGEGLEGGEERQGRFLGLRGGVSN